MQHIPSPTPDRIQIHVLHGSDRFIAWMDVDGIDDLLYATERRMGIGEADRGDQISHMRLRLLAVDALKDRSTSAANFTEWTAALVMWLAFRHYRHGEALRRTLDERTTRGRPSVLSVGIAYPPASQPGTAWSFHIEDEMVDARAELAAADGVTIKEGFA